MPSFMKATLPPSACSRSPARPRRSSAGRRRRPTPGCRSTRTLVGGEGSGNVTVVVDPPKGTACYIINVAGLDGVTAAHIHTGGPGENGAPVVPFEAPEGGTSGGCAKVTAEVSAALLANPGGYYVNVHTRAFPGGAIRGQLASKVLPRGGDPCEAMVEGPAAQTAPAAPPSPACGRRPSPRAGRIIPRRPRHGSPQRRKPPRSRRLGPCEAAPAPFPLPSSRRRLPPSRRVTCVP